MKKYVLSIILIILLSLTFVACKEEPAPIPQDPIPQDPIPQDPTPQDPTPPGPSPSATYTVTFVDKSNVTIEIVTYKAGEKLEDRSPNSTNGSIYWWDVDDDTVITQDMTVKLEESPSGGLIVFKDLDGKVVKRFWYQSSDTLTKSQFPAVPEKSGYKGGTWDCRDSISISTGYTYEIAPYYFSSTTYANGMPVSIIASDGYKFYPAQFAVANASNETVTYVNASNNYEAGQGTLSFNQTELTKIWGYFSMDSDRKAFNSLSTKDKSDFIIDHITGAGNPIAIIKGMRTITGESTWSLPKNKELNLIVEALRRYCPDYLTFLKGSKDKAVFLTANNFGRTGSGYSLCEVYNAYSEGTNTTSEAWPTATGFVWPVHF